TAPPSGAEQRHNGFRRSAPRAHWVELVRLLRTVVHGDPIPALTSTTSPASSIDHLEDAWAPVQAVVARVVVRLEDAELEKARHRVPVGLVRTPVASLCISYREDR